MAYVFVDDGYPDSEEYASNYVWYDPKDPQPLRAAIAKANEIFADRRSHRTTPATKPLSE